MANAPPGFAPHPEPLVLDGGMPNSGFFPIDSIDVNVVDYPFQKSLQLPLGNSSLENLSSGTSVEDLLKRLAIDGQSRNHVHIAKIDKDPEVIDLAQGLQYSEVEGMPQLLEFTRALIERAHKPAFDDWTTVITNGAGDGINKAFDAFLDPGDVVLIEEFTFTPLLQNVENCGAIAVPIKLNMSTEPGKSEGLDLDYLTHLLSHWDTEKPELKGKKPKALYTIASGQNPTGFTQLVEFRKKVYALAEKHDFAIIEDDPYGYLALPLYEKPVGYHLLREFLTVEDYLKHHLVPSYLTLDNSGRVVRIETFSKLFAPGLRLGFMVGHRAVIDVVANYANVVTRSSSGAAQLLVNNVIRKSFGGVDGWLEWILKMRLSYTNRRNVMLFHLFELEAYAKGYYNVIYPVAGMFVSVVINFPAGTDIAKKVDLLQWKFRHFGVRVVAGINMAVDKAFSVERANFFRLTYAPANTDAEIGEGARRFAAAVADFFAHGLEFA